MLDRYGDGFYPYYWAGFVLAGKGTDTVPFGR